MKKWKLREKSWEIAVILLCMAVLGFGVSGKEGYHMDELLSFELSNAQFNPWIVPTQPQGRLAKFVENEIQGENFSETLGNLWETAKDVLVNRGNSKMLSYTADISEEPVWIDRETFADYITVDEDAFSYLSVYFNVKDDNHPPLHFMVLHTVSSIFRGQIAPFMGCVINMAAVAGIMVLLMNLGRLFSSVFGFPGKGRALGILAALLYGLSAGAMATALLIRMYAMLTFFCVAFFYLCMKKWLKTDFRKKNFPLIAVTVLGFWTQYFFLFYCIILAVVLALVLWLLKRRREVFCLARSMVIAAAVGLAGFPFAVSDVLSSGRGMEALDNLARGFAGFGERIGAFFEILIERTFGSFWWALLAMAVMCFGRWVWSKFSQGRYRGERSAKEQSVERPETQKERATAKCALSLLLVPVLGYFLLAARMAPYLVDRYIMPLFPFVMLCAALLIFCWLGVIEAYWKEKSQKTAAALVIGMTLLAQAVRLANYDGTYLYRGYAAQEQFAQKNGSLPCICVYEGFGYYENLPEFTFYEKTLLVKPEELARRSDRDSITALPEAVVLVKNGVQWEQVRQIMEEAYGFTLKEISFEATVHGDIISVFKKEAGKALE